MKLELKHIAPYLPFSLRFKAKNDVWEMTEINTTSQWKVWAGTEWCCKDLKFKPPINCKDNAKGYGFELHEVKPILRPLSDLDKNITHNGKTFNPVKELIKMPITKESNALMAFYSLNTIGVGKYLEDVANYGDINPKYLSYPLASKLMEWHFDIYHLIDDGLAIDINELNNK